jgi:Tfp pilus assembly protein PilP
VSEAALTGIIQGRGTFTAIVRGPDGRSHIVHTGDRLLDGIVKSITATTLVMLEEVNDPLSLTKQREVKKTLRVLEEVK